MGHHEGYAHLPWPSDVTEEQAEKWLGEYESRARAWNVGVSPCLEDMAAIADTVPSQLDRIEAKLDALLEALADEGEEMDQAELTLDGEAVGGERDDTQPL